MEAQSLLIVFDCRLHHEIRLISHHVVHLLELNGSHDAVEGLLQVVRSVAWQEASLIIFPLNKSMDCVPIGFY